VVKQSVVVAGTRTYWMSVKPSSRRNCFASAAGGSHADGLTNRTVVISGGGSVAPVKGTPVDGGLRAEMRPPPANTAAVPAVRLNNSRLVTMSRRPASGASSHRCRRMARGARADREVRHDGDVAGETEGAAIAK